METKNLGGRPSVADKVKQQTGRDLADLLAEYGAQGRSPESIASELGCSVNALISNAADFGFKIIRTFHPCATE